MDKIESKMYEHGLPTATAQQCAAITQEVAVLFARWCQDEDWTPTLESYQHYITHIFKPTT